MTVEIGLETPDDVELIHRTNTVAFDGRTEEADLVDELREAGDLLLSLVARRDGEVIGHVAFSRLLIDTASGPVGGVALAPVGVLPGCQDEGVGSDLIRKGLAMLADREEQVVLVVGNPAYYDRFGFSSAVGKRYPSRHSGPHLMALVLGDPTTAPIGPVRYPEAFGLVN
ncbi:MAG: N-acetyltransferase [Acidimicrobiia bacterium]|nr:N-acetyltransferase [Acidimicrobiia bacterium]